ncbi:MAG: polysaccharide deacetylase family protein [Clostridia bacterium]|nr:polysaccharide deacetylase family protein [Clostridia bacterium]
MVRAILTIDDISSKNTKAMVDYLVEKKITAVMFAAGENVEKFYDEAVYAIQKGMIVGNHSYTHRAFSTLSLEEGIEDIEKCEAVLNKLYKDSGVERRYRPFRFPYGDQKDNVCRYTNGGSQGLAVRYVLLFYCSSERLKNLVGAI